MNDSLKKDRGTTPKISVIIPVYNDEKGALTTTINIVLGQTHRNFEIIVVDDGSELPIIQP